MATDAEIEERFWKELEDSPTVMLSIVGERGGIAQPMTVQFEGRSGPLWTFTSKDTSLARTLGQSGQGAVHYVGKGHDLFATITGRLTVENDPAVIDSLWNDTVAAWYPQGRSDPNICLLRFDADEAEIWLHATGIGTALRRAFGADAKEVQAAQRAKVGI